MSMNLVSWAIPVEWRSSPILMQEGKAPRGHNLPKVSSQGEAKLVAKPQWSQLWREKITERKMGGAG